MVRKIAIGLAAAAFAMAGATSGTLVQAQQGNQPPPQAQQQQQQTPGLGGTRGQATETRRGGEMERGGRGGGNINLNIRGLGGEAAREREGGREFREGGRTKTKITNIHIHHPGVHHPRVVERERHIIGVPSRGERLVTTKRTYGRACR